MIFEAAFSKQSLTLFSLRNIFKLISFPFFIIFNFIFLYFLLNTTKEDLIKVTDEKIADAILVVREGKVKIKPGYDGVYGQPIFNGIGKKKSEKEKTETKQEQQGLNKFF